MQLRNKSFEVSQINTYEAKPKKTPMNDCKVWPNFGKWMISKLDTYFSWVVMTHFLWCKLLKLRQSVFLSYINILEREFMSISLGLAKHQNSRMQVKILSIAIKNNNN